MKMHILNLLMLWKHIPIYCSLYNFFYNNSNEDNIAISKIIDIFSEQQIL